MKLTFPHDILINWMPYETRVAIIENGAVQELHVERSAECGFVGNVYLGKVARVLPGMQSAFIEIGLEKAGFLHVADLFRSQLDENTGEKKPLPLIEKILFEGQAVMVQVVKDPLGTKGVRLTMQISLPGRQLVYFPQEKHIGISQKIAPELRDMLREKMLRLTQGQGGGFILRTNAEDADDDELEADMLYLRKTWEVIKDRALKMPTSSLLHQDLRLSLRVLRDLVSEDTQSIRIDSHEQYENLKRFSSEYMPQLNGKLHCYEGDRPIFDLYKVDEEIKLALSKRVDLKSGAYLIIDQTEALTTIDVNTGGFVGARNFDETIYKTNLEATRAIARQLRLRNLGGIIIVDFIDMLSEVHRDDVLAELSKQLQKDRVKTTVSGFSQLGLVEMTRKRARESLARALCEPCPECHGGGRVKAPNTVAYDIMREILREARQFNPREIRVIAAPQVIELFLDENAHLALLSDFIKKPISLKSELSLGQEQFDIVLL